jgi:hypothetical protein
MHRLVGVKSLTVQRNNAKPLRKSSVILMLINWQQIIGRENLQLVKNRINYTIC